MNRIFTIPNILSMFRLALIPLIVYLTIFTQLTWLAGVVTMISGLTDLLDGYIARKYNQISNLGKILDPVADKLTLLTVLACVIILYPPMILLLFAEVVKDIFVGITSYIRIRNTCNIHCSEWEGKVCTALSYVFILVTLILNIPSTYLAIILIIVSSLITILGVCYGIKNLIKGASKLVD